ncbi:MAG: hypothetical protein L0L66_07740 [Bifidobacterium crudilactis]|uniref:hypothetical protein n=1 Tax=Bifidobacterium crudilactis TaxID=327277 RepID=UPI0026483781|nr:hypothetical protein [Bifidobacterium crudilactis]MDN5973545.1 hypothetical protein [Bifidobacterium crudilactis]MDN6210416.1 hypothetical protein [Bifidobacterium crudilactis]MDN6817302.1 hypothetical protein [Bifidobacterium crudilactis]MDN6832084.1 hypothetical protein [Bifidobacterium crudilactis]MDN6854602.1 hypothetical protein [Bifidobacterium crudilactis]
MGERTQLLVSYQQRFKDENGNFTTSRAALSMHYQWGYGRVMLMDAMSFAWGLQNTTPGQQDIEGDWLARWLTKHANCNGTLNFCSPFTQYHSDGVTPIAPNLHETMDYVFYASDNNDGYGHLEIIKDGQTYDTEAKLHLYDHDQHAVSLADYVTRGHGEKYATQEWQEAYRTLLGEINCQICE